MKVPGEMRGRGFIEPANRESAAGLGASGLLQSDVAYSLSPPICHSLFSRKQLVPRATQGALNAEQRRQEDVQLARLDLLYGANVQVHQFGETLLCQPACDTFAAHVSTEPFQLRFDLLSLSTSFPFSGAKVSVGKPRTERYEELRYALVTNQITVSKGDVCVLDGFRLNKSPGWVERLMTTGSFTVSRRKRITDEA